jgi:hypothetical protein
MHVDDLDHVAPQQGQMLLAHRLHSRGASLLREGRMRRAAQGSG